MGSIFVGNIAALWTSKASIALSTFDHIFKSSSHKKVDIDLIDGKFAQLRKDYKALKHPVVLCHGFFGFDRLVLIPWLSPSIKVVEGAMPSGLLYVDYWHGIKEALEEQGNTVLIARVPPFGRIEERALALNEFIESKIPELQSRADVDGNITPNDSDEPLKLNLIGHSMGGLDCRYLISSIEQKNYEVVSLTTISTPHHGSEMANYCRNINHSMGRTFYLPPSIYELTSDFLKKFNTEVTDDPKVKYFSYGARFFPRWYNLFSPSWKLVYKAEGDNDGLVSCKSARWGQYLGTVNGVDHLDLINWTNQIGHQWIGNTKQHVRGFSAIALYLDITDTLAKQGF